METKTLSQSDKAFFPTLGPFFVSEEVRRATGSPMTSTPEHRWTVVTEGKRVVALAGVLPHKNGNAEFVAVYAVDGDEAAKRAAIEGALADAQGRGLRELRILAKIENGDLYRGLGFAEGAVRGGFRQFSRAVQGA